MTNVIEAMARAICRKVSGYYPPADEAAWRDYIPAAKESIQALIDSEWPEVIFPHEFVASNATYEDTAKYQLKSILNQDREI